MNFTYLKYFFDTAKQGSTRAAAELNYVSQPAISQGIKKLELELSLNLLNHKRNSIQLTSDGREVVASASILFQSIKRYRKSIECIQKGEEGKICVGISSSLVGTVLAPVLKVFSKKYPQIDVEIKIGKTLDQAKYLDAGEIDIGIAIDNGGLSNYTVKKLRKGSFLLVGLKNSPDKLLITEKRPETILFKDSSSLFSQEMQIESWSTILNLVKSGYGKGLVPDFLIPERKELVNFSDKKRLKKPAYHIVSFSKVGHLSAAQSKFMIVLESILKKE